MPLNRPRFTVWVNGTTDEPTEYDVVVTHQDQLKGEVETARAGIDPQTRSLALTTAWVWCALVRTEDYSGPFKRFYDIDCAGLETPKGSGDEETVDPTQPVVATGSPSPSPESGPESTG